MRLLSYNIHKGFGNDRRYRLERVIGVIEEENPDLICLQEVDQNVSRTSHDDQPRMLAEHFKATSHHYQLNVPRKQGGYGNLILSRWPIRYCHSISLRLRWRKPRGAQLAVVHTPHGPLHLVNWHLGLSGKERHWQVRHVLSHERFHEHAHLPTVIVGDYNDWRNTLEHGPFAAHQFRQVTAPLKEFRSFPSFWAITSLDKCYIRGGVEVTRARVVRTSLARRASDHLPLSVEIRLTRMDKPGTPLISPLAPGTGERRRE